MKLKQMGAAAVWLVTAGVLAGGIALPRVGLKKVGDHVPAAGAQLDMQEIGTAFSIEPFDSAAWLLIVTSSCPFCLGLDEELSALREEAKCANAQLTALVVEMGAPPDSMLTLLAKHRIQRVGLGQQTTLNVLQTSAVPSVLRLDAEGRVLSVANPAIDGSWPMKCER